LLPLLICGAEAPAQQSQAVFARIDDMVISTEDYQRIFRAAVKNRYYHGRVPEAELIRFQRQVGQDLVDQILVHREALRLGMKPDTEAIKSGVAAYDARYSQQRQWQEARERELPAMLIQLERRDLLLQMEEKVRQLPDPTTADTKTYYLENPHKFTEPERKQVSIILLKVSPSAASAEWEAARLRAENLRFMLAEGAVFSDMAREYSDDTSATTGGDLGPLHRGRLAPEAEKALDLIEVGQVTEPILLLEGIALLRLNGIIPAKLLGFDAAEQRAGKLLIRERQEQAWRDYLQGLRVAAEIEINESLYVSRSEQGVQANGGVE
jgi:parvulin-like peptidyl-prolyl isomerase